MYDHLAPYSDSKRNSLWYEKVGGNDWGRSFNPIGVSRISITDLIRWLNKDEGLEIIGDKDDNRLLGWYGPDTLTGGKGDEILDGESGADILTGGAGADWFVISEGDDVITDFNPAEGDRLIIMNDPGFSIVDSDSDPERLADTIISTIDGNINTTIQNIDSSSVKLAVQQRLLPTKKITFDNGEIFESEVAETPLQQSLGMMQRGPLDSRSGMLFLKEESSVSSVWMYNCLEPLDILFLDGNEIIYVQSEVPIYEGIDPSLAPTYGPEEPFTSFLELRSGTIDSLGIKAGTFVDIESI